MPPTRATASCPALPTSATDAENAFPPARRGASRFSDAARDHEVATNAQAAQLILALPWSVVVRSRLESRLDVLPTSDVSKSDLRGKAGKHLGGRFQAGPAARAMGFSGAAKSDRHALSRHRKYRFSQRAGRNDTFLARLDSPRAQWVRFDSERGLNRARWRPSEHQASRSLPRAWLCQEGSDGRWRWPRPLRCISLCSLRCAEVRIRRMRL